MPFETAYNSRALRTSSRALAEILASNDEIRAGEDSLKAIRALQIDALASVPNPTVLVEQAAAEFADETPTTEQFLELIDQIAAAETRRDILTRYGTELSKQLIAQRDSAAQSAVAPALAELGKRYVKLVKGLRALKVRAADADPAAAVDQDRGSEAAAVRKAARDVEDILTGAVDIYLAENVIANANEMNHLAMFALVGNMGERCPEAAFVLSGHGVENIQTGDVVRSLPYPDPLEDMPGFLAAVAADAEAVPSLAGTDQIGHVRSRLGDIKRQIAGRGKSWKIVARKVPSVWGPFPTVVHDLSQVDTTDDPIDEYRLIPLEATSLITGQSANERPRSRVTRHEGRP